MILREFCIMGMSKIEQQNYAKLLVVNEKITFKETSIRVGVREKTIGDWAKKFNWIQMKRSLITIKDEQITSLYNKLEKLNKNIEENQDNLVTTKDVDAIIKLTAAIKQLEVDTSLGEIIDVGKKFITFLQETDIDLAKEVTRYYDTFIQSKLK
ncbi:MAG: hypothetical protein ABI207_00665 [Crocinitomicaceae bacterium]